MSTDTIAWVIARGSGFATFLLLTASVAAGLAMSLRLSSSRWPAKLIREVHEHLTSLALWTLGLHVVMLLLDPQSKISPIEAIVPFGPDYRPLATTLGIVAMYTTLVVIVSSRMRSRIGACLWRRLHFLAFLAWSAALGHGILAGTDSGTPWAKAVYIGAIALVGGMTIKRVLRPSTPRRTAPPAEPAAPRPGASLPPLPGRQA